MTTASAFTRVGVGLEGVLDELRAREPIFHTQEFGMVAAERERVMAPDYWEVGASGRRYDREFILRTPEQTEPVDASEAGWACSEFGLRQMGPETYLLTYTMDQSGRITRCATVWQRRGGEWRILFHQGTMAMREDDTRPA